MGRQIEVVLSVKRLENRDMKELNTRETGTCPACEGTLRVSRMRAVWKNHLTGYEQVPEVGPCTNCGGQYMFGTPAGRVPLNESGKACLHQYIITTVRGCYRKYCCSQCGDIMSEDSGD